MRYFIGNWKMFGVPKSINIVNKINTFVKSDKKHNRKSLPPKIDSKNKPHKKKYKKKENKGSGLIEFLFGSNYC